MEALLARIADDVGTPCFVYFLDDIRQRVADIRREFEGLFDVSYAVKSNPHPVLLAALQESADRLDVSSGGELALGLETGWPASRLSFTGPAKRTSELELALTSGIGEVILESVSEAHELDRLAGAMGRRQAVLLRIAPSRLPRGFGVNMAGKPTQFGIDEEEADEALAAILELPHVDVAGFHCYSGTQCLKPDALAENYGIFADLFEGLSERHDLKPRMFVFGSGLGIPYHDGDTQLDLAAVAAGALPRLRALKAHPRFADTALVLETGRYLVGEAGIYLTRVVRTKRSRGTDIAICDGGMNHHLGACGHLGSVIHRNYPLFKVSPSSPDGETGPVDLVGPLCTSIDTLGHGATLPAIAEGDVLGVGCSGAYGPTASPIYFISHPAPREVLVTGRGDEATFRDISRLA